MTYFWRPKPVGLKKDIEQHRLEEKALRTKIAELEVIPDPTPFQERALRTYWYLLDQLLQSKANTASKIGKK